LNDNGPEKLDDNGPEKLGLLRDINRNRRD
jgi:hypothetical protein